MEAIKKDVFPSQHQNMQPGKESEMNPLPQFISPSYKASGKLEGKVAIITGGDSGIGRAIATLYAMEGADIVIVYLNENEDAKVTEQEVLKLGKRCLKIPLDLKQEENSQKVVDMTLKEFGKIDILINNAAVQYPQNSIVDITKDQMMHTFESNFFSYFYLTKATLPHLKKGSSIINTTSITAFEGHPTLIDYSATKGAILTFTRSMALSLVKQEIRVNAVAPGPIWTPLIVSSFSAEDVKTFGSTAPMGRAGQPCEVAPMYVLLASEDSTYITGQVFHINGGKVVN
ncbi:MAG: short-chain dehydrogenase/reductase [Bacillales bacterium]|jgi:NAD(P)-dependent dehydrogenase (short-subunit alcohol dehydrogenase family)|nr:short-chain dehydrogenase/reductase [Bacillales bacterium]